MIFAGIVALQIFHDKHHEIASYIYIYIIKKHKGVPAYSLRGVAPLDHSLGTLPGLWAAASGAMAPTIGDDGGHAALIPCRERDTSLLTTYWSESTLSSR